MKLDDIEEVIGLRNHRNLAVGLHEAARSGYLGDWTVQHDGRGFGVFAIISAEPIRQAVMHACSDFIVKTDARLRALGVEAPEHKASERDLASWKDEADMLARAWLRELGNRVFPKSHLIDALVLTTRDIRQKAERFDELQSMKKPIDV